MQGDQRIMLTKRLLKEALLRLMERKETDKINVSELCKEAGINRATFYRHYNVPRDILTEMQSEFAERLREVCGMEEVLASPERYVETLCTYLYEHAELVRIFIRNNPEEEIVGLFDDFSTLLLKEDKSLTAGYPLDDNEQRLVSAYMSGGGYFMLRRWLLDGVDKSPAEIARMILFFMKMKKK